MKNEVRLDPARGSGRLRSSWSPLVLIPVEKVPSPGSGGVSIFQDQNSDTISVFGDFGAMLFVVISGRVHLLNVEGSPSS